MNNVILHWIYGAARVEFWGEHPIAIGLVLRVGCDRVEAPAVGTEPVPAPSGPRRRRP